MEKAGFVKWYPDRKEYFTLLSRKGFTERLKKETEASELFFLHLMINSYCLLSLIALPQILSDIRKLF